MSTSTTRAEARDYYEDFSLATGLRDWLQPNQRHEAIRMQLKALLSGRKNLRLIDIGCGAGVLTHHLKRYGRVTGIDFSSAAIDAARRFAPGIDFRVGSLEDLSPSDRFDVITLFDVLEHIPADERPAFFAGLRQRLVDGGLVFASTPFPTYTRSRRERKDPTLQIIDEEIMLPTVLEEAAAAGLQLISFVAYDVFRGSPEYQAMVLTTERAPGGPPELRLPAFERRLRLIMKPSAVRARRYAHAARLAARGRFATAKWFINGRAPHVES